MSSLSPAALPKDHLGLAVLSIVVGVWPVGIVATVYATRVTRLLLLGEVERAERASQLARRWALASLLSLPALLALLLGVGLLLRVLG